MSSQHPPSASQKRRSIATALLAAVVVGTPSCKGERAASGPGRVASSAGKAADQAFMLRIPGFKVEAPAGAIGSDAMLVISEAEVPTEFSAAPSLDAVSDTFRVDVTSGGGALTTTTLPLQIDIDATIRPPTLDAEGFDVFETPCMFAKNDDGRLRVWRSADVGFGFDGSHRSAMVSSIWPGVYQAVYCGETELPFETSTGFGTRATPPPREPKPSSCDLRLVADQGSCQTFAGQSFQSFPVVQRTSCVASGGQYLEETPCPEGDNALGTCVVGLGTTDELAWTFYLETMPVGVDVDSYCAVLGGTVFAPGSYTPTPFDEQEFQVIDGGDEGGGGNGETDEGGG